MAKDGWTEKSAYHVTLISNLPSILKFGIMPTIGDRSQLYGERTPRVYLFPTKEDCDTALEQWLGEQYEDVPDNSLAIIKVSLENSAAVSSDVEYEIALDQTIHPDRILNVTNENGAEIILHRGDIQSHCQNTCLVVNDSLFGEDLARFAHDTIEVIADAHGYGWLDGGCLIFAKALHRWSDGAIKVFGINSMHTDGSLILDHAVGLIHIDGIPFPLCIDANGVGSPCDAYKSLFGRNCHNLIPFPFEQTEIPEDPSLCEIIAKKLLERFGYFDQMLVVADLIEQYANAEMEEYSHAIHAP